MINLVLIERYGFKMHIDGVHVGDICPSAETEWATYVKGQTKRISTSSDIFDAIDDLENHYLKEN